MRACCAVELSPNDACVENGRLFGRGQYGRSQTGSGKGTSHENSILASKMRFVTKVTPMTALKFAELSARAGFPKGVINILPGSGSIVGQALADHPDVRKLGFTGSTPIGKTIMKR